MPILLKPNERYHITERFMDIGEEVSDINVKPSPFTNEQIQEFLGLAAKYGLKIRPD